MLWRRPSCGRWLGILNVHVDIVLQQREAAGEPREELSTQYFMSSAVQTAGMQAPSWEIPITLLN